MKAVYTIQDIVAEELDGSVLKSQIRQTDCLHNVDGHWYSYVESVSWPIDEATDKAIINLADTNNHSFTPSVLNFTMGSKCSRSSGWPGVHQRARHSH